MEDIIWYYGTRIRWVERDGSRVACWVNCSQLRPSMESLIDSHPSYNKEHWGRYFLNNLPDDRSEKHLLACFEKECDRAAKAIFHQKVKQLPNLRSEYTQPTDLFSLGWLGNDTKSPTEFFTGFDYAHKSATVIGYIYGKFLGIIRDQIFTGSLTIVSDWRLVKKSSQHQLRIALEHQRCSQQNLSRYFLAHSCFEEIYRPNRDNFGKITYPKPTPNQLIEIANFYNQRRYDLSPIAVEVNPATIEEYLKECISALREYRSPRSPRSLADFEELIDRIESPHKSADLDTLDIKNSTPLLREALPNLLESLKPKDQCFLFLKYGYGRPFMNEHDLAAILNCNVNTVSSNCDRAKKRLFEKMAKWAVITWEMSNDLRELESLIERLRSWKALEDFLNEHYQEREINPVIRQALTAGICPEEAIASRTKQKLQMAGLSFIRTENFTRRINALVLQYGIPASNSNQ